MKREIRNYGDKLNAAGKNSVGLFYYAGHGVEVTGRNFLITIDAKIKCEADVDIEGGSAQALLRQMEYAENRLNIVMLDACRDNPYKSGFRCASRGLARMPDA